MPLSCCHHQDGINRLGSVTQQGNTDMLILFSSTALADVFMIAVMGMALLAWLVAITLPINLLMRRLKKRQVSTAADQQSVKE